MYFSTVACKENNFLCNNRKCILWIFTCNRINDCGDNSDESDSCDTLNISQDQGRSFAGKFFGGIFGAAAGVLFLIVGTIITVILTCIYNKKCPIYKQRRRRHQPPVVVITVGEQNEVNVRDDISLITNNDEQGKRMLRFLVG